jgi:hypothetical protein
MSAAGEINPAVAMHVPWTVVRLLPPAITPYRMCDYIADCPNHPTGNRALSVRIADGTPTVACDWGCDPRDIWRAVDIDPDDLRAALVRWASAPLPKRLAARDLRTLAAEAEVIATAGDDIASGVHLSDSALRRVRTAAARLRAGLR